MKQTLSQFGYSPAGSCHCSGFHVDKYEKDDYQLQHSERREIFKIKKGGRSITQWVPVSKIEETLNSVHNVALQA